MSNRLPDFFVLGAQKAGTTTLHDRLARHPEVCLPVLKETQFFTTEDRFSLGLDWYSKQFPACKQQVMGEVCPDYMFFKGAAERIRSCVKNPKLIFIFRNPLERAYSHYLMSVRQGFESLSFAEALEAEEKRVAQNESSMIYHSYLSRGRYAEQVKAFQAVFPASNYMFIMFEDLVDKGAVGEATFAKICDFLGITHMHVGTGVHSNAASEPRMKWLRDQLYGKSFVKSAIGLLLPQSVKEKIAVSLDNWNQRAIKKKDMGKIPSTIIEEVKVEIERLQSITGMNLNEWLVQVLEKENAESLK